MLEGGGKSANRTESRHKVPSSILTRDLSSDRFEIVLDSISDGVFAVDQEWRIACFNRAAEKATGVKRKDALGRRCRDVFRSNICREACAPRYTMETGKPVVNLAINMRNIRDEPVRVTISTALLKDKQGRIVGGVETFRDLDRVKEFLREVESRDYADAIVTNDPKLKHLLEIVPNIARSDSTVLLEGESGTGKGLFAKMIHNHSSRCDGPFVTINCGALPENLLESELFGYKAGAFTGATKDKPGRISIAKGGTLFLDEVGDLPLQVQVKLLRLLQENVFEPLGDLRTVDADVRIVAATNRGLGKLVDEGAFRTDLYYRINVIRIELPTLGERMSDIPLLVEHFLRRLSMTRGKQVKGISRDALDLLMTHGFPGNVRELENLLEHGFVLCSGPVIEAKDLPEWLFEKTNSLSPGGASRFENLEASFIREVLARNEWSRMNAARELGIHKTTLHRKIRKLGIELPGTDGRSSRRKKKLARTTASHDVPQQLRYPMVVLFGVVAPPPDAP